MALSSESVPYISVCSGGGGLDAGVRLAISGARCVCYVEREAPAVAALVAAIEAGTMDDAPVWSDAATFDGKPWRGRVAGVVGGTPCQDLSLAGKRAGLHGERSGLFFEFVRIIRECQPEWVVWENVGGATSALPAVFAAFEAEGYRGAWARVRASDVGAPHERARVFLLAHRDGSAFGQQPGRSGWAGGTGAPVAGFAGDHGGGAPLEHAAGLAQREPQHEAGALPRGDVRADALGGCHPLGNRNGPGLEERGALGGDGEAQREALGGAGLAGLPLWPPGPADVSGWERVLAVAPWLAPTLPQPGIRGVVDGMALVSGGLDRLELLRLLGNGVVPQQAAHAIRGLALALLHSSRD
jgi:DNA (cytosine-5)-methyltransferase 1